MGYTKDQYAAPAHNSFYFSSPVEGEPRFLPALERLQTLYPGAYARGAISTSEGAENWFLNVKLSPLTHPVAAGLESSLGGGDPPPTRPPSLVGAPIHLSPVSRKTWPDGESAYGDQKKIQIYQHWWE